MEGTDGEELLLQQMEKSFYRAISKGSNWGARSPNKRPRKWTSDLSPQQGINYAIPDAQAADAQTSLSQFPV